MERAAGMRALQAAALAGTEARWVAAAGELEPAPGLVVANELLDALPVHVLEPPDEVLVGLDGDGRPGGGRAVRRRASCWRCWRAAACRRAPVAATRCGRRRRGCSSCSLAASAPGGCCWWTTAARAPRCTTAVARRCARYVGGGPGGDPLAAPGSQDLTADVDFGHLRRAAARAGLVELAYLDQGEWLERHGAALPPPAARSDEDWRLAGCSTAACPSACSCWRTDRPKGWTSASDR